MQVTTILMKPAPVTNSRNRISYIEMLEKSQRYVGYSLVLSLPSIKKFWDYSSKITQKQISKNYDLFNFA